jgi:hypothetical protein
MALHSFLAPSAWKMVARPVVLVGGALLAGGLGLALLASDPRPLDAPPPAAYRLTLDTESNPICYYGSAWNDGDVFLSHDASDGRIVTLTSRYDFQDGCTWEAVETLTPNGKSGYSYDYAERYVSCRAGASPGIACARRGTVSVSAEQ